MNRAVAAAIGVVMLLVGCWLPPAPIETTPPVGVIVTIDHVRDGDSVAIIMDDQPGTVRLLGVDAPEFGDCGADAAADRLKELLAGRDQAVLIQDAHADARDRFDRHLGYIEVDGIDVGGVLIAEGLAAAWWPRSEPTPERGLDYRAAMADAQRDGLGSWQACGSIGRS